MFTSIMINFFALFYILTIFGITYGNTPDICNAMSGGLDNTNIFSEALRQRWNNNREKCDLTAGCNWNNEYVGKCLTTANANAKLLLDICLPSPIGECKPPINPCRRDSDYMEKMMKYYGKNQPCSRCQPFPNKLPILDGEIENLDQDNDFYIEQINTYPPPPGYYNRESLVIFVDGKPQEVVFDDDSCSNDIYKCAEHIADQLDAPANVYVNVNGGERRITIDPTSGTVEVPLTGPNVIKLFGHRIRRTGAEVETAIYTGSGFKTHNFASSHKTIKIYINGNVENIDLDFDCTNIDTCVAGLNTKLTEATASVANAQIKITSNNTGSYTTVSVVSNEPVVSLVFDIENAKTEAGTDGPGGQGGTGFSYIFGIIYNADGNFINTCDDMSGGLGTVDGNDTQADEIQLWNTNRDDCNARYECRWNNEYVGKCLPGNQHNFANSHETLTISLPILCGRHTGGLGADNIIWQRNRALCNGQNGCSWNNLYDGTCLPTTPLTTTPIVLDFDCKNILKCAEELQSKFTETDGANV